MNKRGYATQAYDAIAHKKSPGSLRGKPNTVELSSASNQNHTPSPLTREGRGEGDASEDLGHCAKQPGSRSYLRFTVLHATKPSPRPSRVGGEGTFLRYADRFRCLTQRYWVRRP